MANRNKDAAVSFLKLASSGNARDNPNKSLDVKLAITEGDLMAVHSRVRLKPGDLGGTVVHLFRFEEGRIVELWDLGQPVPESHPIRTGCSR